MQDIDIGDDEFWSDSVELPILSNPGVELEIGVVIDILSAVDDTEIDSALWILVVVWLFTEDEFEYKGGVVSFGLPEISMTWDDDIVEVCGIGNKDGEYGTSVSSSSFTAVADVMVVESLPRMRGSDGVEPIWQV